MAKNITKNHFGDGQRFIIIQQNGAIEYDDYFRKQDTIICDGLNYFVKDQVKLFQMAKEHED